MKSESRKTMVTSDFRQKVEIWPFRACAVHPAITIGTVRSLWNWLWSRYYFPQNVFLVILCFSSWSLSCLVKESRNCYCSCSQTHSDEVRFERLLWLQSTDKSGLSWTDLYVHRFYSCWCRPHRSWCWGIYDVRFDCCKLFQIQRLADCHTY